MVEKVFAGVGRGDESRMKESFTSREIPYGSIQYTAVRDDAGERPGFLGDGRQVIPGL
jgi:hypothetical protein